MEDTFIDKLVQEDSVSAIRRLVVGGLLAASAPFGVPAVLAMGVACIAINATVFSYEKGAQQKQLLNFYRDEIAAVTHCSPASLTIDDLKRVAAPVSGGGSNITAIKQELDEMNAQQRVRFGLSSICSLITTGILIGLSLANPAFLTSGLISALGLGMIGLGHTIISKAVRTIGEAIVGEHGSDDSINQRLIRISKAIKDKPVNPVDLFGMFADTNHDLQARIQHTFKVSYSDLTVIQKAQVVEALEPEFRVIALTKAINKGEVKPSLVGFIASGSVCDSLPGYGSYESFFEKPVETISGNSFDLASNGDLSDYRTRILTERENVAGKSIH